MWFGKNIMTKLGLVLAMAVPALAADTYPLYYTGKTTAQNNDYWDSLMIFKAWGTTGVDIGGRSALPDESGATGTALGSLSLNDDKVELGGRLLIGGDLTGGNGGHTLNSGSARIRGAITLGNGTANNFKGTYCVTGASTVGGNDVVDGIIYADGTAMGDGQACAMSAEKPISQVFDYLSVPLLHDENVDYTQERIVVVNGTPQKVYGEIVADQKTVAIDVPKMEEGDSKLYDIYLKSITVRNGGRIIVRMPYNGGNRLVRIFLSESISFSGSPRKLQIVYVGKGAEFKDGKWNDVGDDSTVVKNLDYAGNLLFYAKDDITWGAFNGGDTIQGSYVTRGTLTMGTNVALAGQLISEKLIIPQDFNGRGFRYVPFDPPILKLEPTATGEAAYIVERDNASDKINITLDKVAATPISFEYCFEFKGTPDSEKGDGKPYASKEDFIGSLPLYENGACTSTEKASFEPGSLELVGSGIVLKVFNDNIIEDALESFNIRIVNLQGATLESGARDGYIELFVQDNDGKPFGENITVSGTEDIPYVFNAFNVINSDGDALTDYSVVIATFPSKGTLSYVNTDGDTVAVVKNQKIASTDIDAGKFVYKFVEDDYTVDTQADYHRYDFEFRVVDVMGNESDDAYKASVTVAPVNDKPKAESAEFTIKENSVTTTMLTTYAEGDIGATDVENDVLTYSFDLTADTRTAEYYEHVAELYDIEPATGKIFVKEGAKLDYESTDSLLYIKVKVTDDGHTTADPDDAKDTTVFVTIRIVDMNDPPTVADPTFTIPENLGNDNFVGEVVGKDPDSLNQHGFEHLEYFIDPTNSVANAAFKIVDPTKGNITVKNSTKLDYETVPGHKFEFDVLVRNCEYDAVKKDYTANCLEDVVSHVTVELTDEGEPPKIIPVCEGGNCVEICKGDKCEVCVGETCDEHEICTDNCDNPRGDDPAKTLTVAVKEHSQTGHKIISYAVRDEDYGVGHTTALTAEIRNTNGSGADTLFEAKMVKDINGNWNVVVSVIDSAKLDYEKINETHDVTIYVYDPDDPTGMYDSLLRVIKVVDVNEAPKAEDADFKPEENLPDSAVVGELMVVEPDIEHIKEFGHLEYSIIGKDETFVFAMDSNRVIVNDPSKMDYELPVHFYTFDVLIANCELNKTSGKYDVACLYDTAKVTVDIQDVNEKPTIIVDGPIPDGDDDSDPLCVAYCDTTDRGVSTDSILTIGIKENTKDSLLSKTDMVIFQYHVVDPDTGHAMGAKVEWIDFGSSISSSTVKGPDLFDISYDPTTQTIKATVKDEKLLDYEELRKATSREDPDPEYKVGILVTDPNGLKDTLIRVIRIIDVNEKPLYTAEPCVVVEGNHPGDSIGHVEHPSDIDSLSRNPALYDNQFKITGGDFDRFELRKDSTDLMRVMLVALDSIDCENGSYVCGVDSVYWVELTYGDTTLKTVYNNIRIPVKVLDLNEPPEFRTDTIGVAENSPMGTVVDTIKWFDWDRFDTTMHFEISNDSSGCFAIDKNTGIVTVKKDRCAILDHEKNPTLKIEVAITDMVDVTDRSLISGGPNTVKKIIMVNVRDVNEPPTIIEETFSVDEDAKKGSVVDTVKATDPDKDPKFNKLIFTAIGGDTATFKIDSITGIVTLKDTLDYETKSKYELVVRVYDGEYADTAIVPIYVNNKIEKTEVKITLYDDSTKVWRDPDTVFTNSPGREICWVQGRSDRDLKDTCMDVHITKDSVIVIRYKDPTTDSYGVDSLFIFYSNATPIVTISGDQEANLANNFYTIVEDTDKGDTNLYVNERKKDVRVTVKDPANKKDTSFVVKLNLQTVNVPQKTLAAVNKIVNENRFVLNENPKGGVTRTPVNGNEVKYSYREVFGKDTVTVSYMTDNDGNPVLVPVLNDKGKVDSIEVMTVSYNVVIDGKTVTISFVVNAVTGEVLVKDSNGTLMESGASKVASSSSSKGDATSSSSSNKSSVTEGMFLITYSVKDPLGNSTTVSYSVDEKGKMVQNADGDTGYAVAYTYTNKYGNSATQSLFIVLDQKGPTVEILKPLKGQVIRSNYVEVVWTVNGEIQDTLTVQGLDKGPNYIKRFYRDKAGNEAADTVLVIMKDSKDVEIAVVTPVTEMNPDEVKEYYEENPPEEGETFAVSILNPTSGKEVETLKGGSFKTKKGSGEELYPGKEKKHLGPTLALDVKLPTIKDGEGNTGLGGLATLDDLVLPNGKISNIGIGIDTSKLSDELKREYKEYTVEEYVEKFCEDGTSVPSDLSKFNMYKTKMQVNIWVYTSLGNFVDYFSFGQEMNDPEYTNDAGKLKMFFEMKPDKDGFVKADNGKLYATGAYLYKVEATIRSTLRCTILDEAVLHDKPNAKRKGDKIKSDDELLKPFGYKRPKTK